MIFDGGRERRSEIFSPPVSLLANVYLPLASMRLKFASLWLTAPSSEGPVHTTDTAGGYDFGMVMVRTISFSVSRRSEMAEMPEDWIRCKD